MEQRLSIVTLGVADVAASRRFYEQMGWKASSVGDEQIAFFQVGSMVFSLYSLEEMARDLGLESGGSGCASIALAYNVRHKEDVDAVLAEAEQAGARLLKAAEEKPWGGYAGYFADPEGYAWEVAWNPGFELREDGSLRLPW